MFILRVKLVYEIVRCTTNELKQLQSGVEFREIKLQCRTFHAELTYYCFPD